MNSEIARVINGGCFLKVGKIWKNGIADNSVEQLNRNGNKWGMSPNSQKNLENGCNNNGQPQGMHPNSRKNLALGWKGWKQGFC